MGEKKGWEDRAAQGVLAQRRLMVLELAETLGNVAEACRRHGMDRASFYKWKRRYVTDGVDGLRDLPPYHNAHPQTTPLSIVQRIKHLSLSNPSIGCGKIKQILLSERYQISAATVYKILKAEGLSDKRLRWKAMHKLFSGVEEKMNADQRKFFRRYRDFDEGLRSSAFFGEAVYAGTFAIGRLNGLDRIHIHAVIDAHRSFAFGSFTLYLGEILRYSVFPFFERNSYRIYEILHSEQLEITSDEENLLAACVRRAGAKVTEISRERLSERGIFANFIETVRNDFFQRLPHSREVMSPQGLQREFDAWLQRYNAGRSPPRPGANILA